MSDFARLNEKLGKLRQVEPRSAAGRTLAGQDAPARIKAALAEIDETILPRQVDFVSGDRRISLGVANRQLSLIIHADDLDLAEPHVVEGREDAVLGALHGAMQQFFDGPGPWHIVTAHLEPAQVRNMRPDAGAGPAALSAAWGLPQQGASDGQTDPGDVARRFVNRIEDRCKAWLLIEGEEIADSGGSHSAVDWLSERAGGFLDGYYAKRDAVSADGPIAFAFAGGTGASLIYFESGTQAGFATLAPDLLAGALRDWNDSLRA